MKDQQNDPGAPNRALDNDYPRNIRGNAGFSETLEKHDEEEGLEQGRGDKLRLDPASMDNTNRGDNDDRDSHDDLGVPVLGSASNFPEQPDVPRERNQERSLLQELDQGDQMERMAEDSPVWDDSLSVQNSTDEDAASEIGMPRNSLATGDS